jgi:hypothetical protein
LKLLSAIWGIPHDNHHYDYFGWWGLALIKGAQIVESGRFEKMRSHSYIATAEETFNLYATFAWDNKTCGGGGELEGGGIQKMLLLTNCSWLSRGRFEVHVSTSPTTASYYLDWAQR